MVALDLGPSRMPVALKQAWHESLDFGQTAARRIEHYRQRTVVCPLSRRDTRHAGMENPQEDGPVVVTAE